MGLLYLYLYLLAPNNYFLMGFCFPKSFVSSRRLRHKAYLNPYPVNVDYMVSSS